MILSEEKFMQKFQKIIIFKKIFFRLQILHFLHFYPVAIQIIADKTLEMTKSEIMMHTKMFQKDNNMSIEIMTSVWILQTVIKSDAQAIQTNKTTFQRDLMETQFQVQCFILKWEEKCYHQALVQQWCSLTFLFPNHKCIINIIITLPLNKGCFIQKFTNW